MRVVVEGLAHRFPGTDLLFEHLDFRGGTWLHHRGMRTIRLRQIDIAVDSRRLGETICRDRDP